MVFVPEPRWRDVRTRRDAAKLRLPCPSGLANAPLPAGPFKRGDHLLAQDATSPWLTASTAMQWATYQPPSRVTTAVRSSVEVGSVTRAAYGERRMGCSGVRGRRTTRSPRIGLMSAWIVISLATDLV